MRRAGDSARSMRRGSSPRCSPAGSRPPAHLLRRGGADGESRRRAEGPPARAGGASDRSGGRIFRSASAPTSSPDPSSRRCRSGPASSAPTPPRSPRWRSSNHSSAIGDKRLCARRAPDYGPAPFAGEDMARDTADDTPIESRDQLAAHLELGGKPRAEWRIGTEHEKFGFYKDGHAPVPYQGRRGIRALLEGMQGLLGWEPINDGENIIGLADPVGGGAISLEPGGQFELSGAPLSSLHQTCREVHAHLAQVRQVADPLGIGFLGLGMSPKWKLAETPVMPKSRYKIMANYMPKVGSRGLDMMFRTCTVQVNLDFSDEADMRDKMRVGLALQPIATALFANSPVHREPAERLPLLPRRDLARHRSEPHRHAALRLPRRLRLREIRRLGARRADVFRRPRRPLSRHDQLHVPAVPEGRRAERPALAAADDGRLEEPSLDALPGSAAQDLPGNARRRRRARGGGSARCRRSGSGSSTTRPRSTARRR